MLVVEVDGDVHTEARQAEYDAGRTQDLRELGYQVVRFSNDEVLYNLPDVLAQIQRALQGLPARVKPLARLTIASATIATIGREQAQELKLETAKKLEASPPSPRERGLGGEANR